MALSKQQVQTMYKSGAKRYDLFLRLYSLIGFRMETYRLCAIELLHLQPGDRVLELGCGTGLNFPHIIEKIGPEGRLIGVDFTAEMLACARERVEQSGWKNIELIQSDIAEYDFPEGINKVLSTGVFGFITEYDRVIEAASHALVPDGRLAIMDCKYPKRWPLWLLKLFVRLGQSFGLTHDYFNHHCWASVERHFQEAVLEEMYGGMMYVSCGTTPLPKA